MSVLQNLRQCHLDWMLGRGVPPKAIVSPTSIMLAKGSRAEDGRFDPDEAGAVWFTFTEELDTVFWHPDTGGIAVDTGRAFALGEELIGNPGSTAFDQWLCIYDSPLEWLRASRNGIYILPDRWPWAFEMLRDVERVAVHESLISTYQKHMKPRLPKLAVLPKKKGLAA